MKSKGEKADIKENQLPELKGFEKILAGIFGFFVRMIIFLVVAIIKGVQRFRKKYK